ncbi:MAG: iron-sulfur cluster assembly scaffold protein [Patescibacteria group bacterium]
MTYSNKVLKHFKNPHNQGVIKNADAVGTVGNPVCGDVMKIYLKVDTLDNAKRRQDEANGRQNHANGRQNNDKSNLVIKDIKFETLGCAAAIAVSSALTDMVKGKTFKEAMKVTKDEIVKDLGGLPAIKIHCSMLAVEALHKAIADYEVRSKN